MNKTTLLLLCSCIASLNAMNFLKTKYKFKKEPVNSSINNNCINLDTIPVELITTYMFSMSENFNSRFMALVNKFGLKGCFKENYTNKANEYNAYYEHIIKPLIILTCTNKSLQRKLSSYVNQIYLGKEITHVSCNDIYEYVNQQNMISIFLKQHIPINVINNRIVTCPSNIIITDYTPLLQFSIDLFNEPNAPVVAGTKIKVGLLLKFNIDFGNTFNRQNLRNAITPSILEEINMYFLEHINTHCADKFLKSPSIICNLLGEHQTLFENAQRICTFPNNFSVNVEILCNFKNNDRKIPLTSLNFECEKVINTSNTTPEEIHNLINQALPNLH